LNSNACLILWSETPSFHPKFCNQNEKYVEPLAFNYAVVHWYFWRTRRIDFGYYKHDQTKNPMTCCAKFFQKNSERSSNS